MTGGSITFSVIAFPMVSTIQTRYDPGAHLNLPSEFPTDTAPTYLLRRKTLFQRPYLDNYIKSPLQAVLIEKPQLQLNPNRIEDRTPTLRKYVADAIGSAHAGGFGCRARKPATKNQ